MWLWQDTVRDYKILQRPRKEKKLVYYNNRTMRVEQGFPRYRRFLNELTGRRGTGPCARVLLLLLDNITLSQSDGMSDDELGEVGGQNLEKNLS